MADLGSLAALVASFASRIADNNTNAISEQDVRDSLSDLADTIYGSGLATKQAARAELSAVHLKGTAVASAATVDLAAATIQGDTAHVTGTTTISSLGTGCPAGTIRRLIFDGILTLTHHATNLILPTGANITTAAGDVAVFMCENDGAAQWRCLDYQRKDGTALVARPTINTLSAGVITPVPAANFYDITGVTTTGMFSCYVDDNGDGSGDPLFSSIIGISAIVQGNTNNAAQRYFVQVVDPAANPIVFSVSTGVDPVVDASLVAAGDDIPVFITIHAIPA